MGGVAPSSVRLSLGDGSGPCSVLPESGAIMCTMELSQVLILPPASCTMVAEEEDASSPSRSWLCFHRRDGGSVLLCPSSLFTELSSASSLTAGRKDMEFVLFSCKAQHKTCSQAVDRPHILAWLHFYVAKSLRIVQYVHPLPKSLSNTSTHAQSLWALCLSVLSAKSCLWSHLRDPHSLTPLPVGPSHLHDPHGPAPNNRGAVLCCALRVVSGAAPL